MLVPKKFDFLIENPGGERLYFTAEYVSGGYNCQLVFTESRQTCQFMVAGPLELSTLAAIVLHGYEWPQIKALPEIVRTAWLLKLLGTAGVRLAD